MTTKEIIDTLNKKFGIVKDEAWFTSLSKTVHSKNITIAEWNSIVYQVAAVVGSADALREALTDIVECNELTLEDVLARIAANSTQISTNASDIATVIARLTQIADCVDTGFDETRKTFEETRKTFDALRDDKISKTDIAKTFDVSDDTKVLSAALGASILEGLFTGEPKETLYEILLTNGSLGLRYELNSASAKFVGIDENTDYTDDTIEIASMVMNLPVTEISANACANKDISGVSIPHSIKTVGDQAFLNCQMLERVYIPDLAAWCGITFATGSSNPLCSSGEASQTRYIYLNGVQTNEIYIPSGVESIGRNAFRNCLSLEAVHIPRSVTYMAAHAFNGCDNIVIYYEGTFEEWHNGTITSEDDTSLPSDYTLYTKEDGEWAKYSL